MSDVRRCCYAFQECRGPTTCVCYPKGAFGVGKRTIHFKVKRCPHRGAVLTKADYGMIRRRYLKPGEKGAEGIV